MFDRLEQVIKNRDIVIPSLLFYNYKKLKIDSDELVLLVYLLNGDSFFNPKKISSDLSITFSGLMEKLDHLKELDLISIDLKKVNNIRAEVINMDGFYNKLIGLLMNEEQAEQKNNIFDVFEKEFGRTLSPIEYEIINAWQESKIPIETIIMALKEAVYNGVNNLRYIDKILSEWSKKGIKTAEDLEKSKKKFHETKKEVKEDIEYDWLNDEE